MPKQPRAVPSADGPFFAKQLPGENPLSGATARALLELAQRYYAQQPWLHIDGDDGFLLDVLPGRPPVAATILGRAGEVNALKIYENAAAMRYIIQLLQDGPSSLEAFLHRRQLLSLDFGKRSELTAPDRDLLEALAWDKKAKSPFLRAGRPGFFDWYLTEEDGQRFVEFLKAVLWFVESHTPEELARLAERDGWPRIQRQADGGYRLDLEPTPLAPLPPPEPVMTPSSELLAKLKPFSTTRLGPIEMEAILTTAVVGGKNERPQFITLVLACDAESGFVLAPQAAEASQPIAPVLAEALSSAIQSLGGIPSEIRHAGSLDLLKPLATALGIKLKHQHSLPMIQQAAGALMEVL